MMQHIPRIHVFISGLAFQTLSFVIFFLQDPNQLIRASALRVLSSIRVTIIVPIMMLAIKEAASDMSPYVRKTAAHAIPKLYRYSVIAPQGGSWGFRIFSSIFGDDWNSHGEADMTNMLELHCSFVLFWQQ